MGFDLTRKEKLVYNEVKEYLIKNRTLEKEKILSFIHYKFKLSSTNINLDGIKSILKTLIEKNLIVEGSKLIREEVLENNKRRLIYEYVLKHPGSLYTRIVKDLNLSNHVVIWHLYILQKFRYIEKGIIDNREIYYEPNLKLDKAEKYYYVSRTKSRKIIQLLGNNDKGYTKNQISKNLHMHNSTVSKYIDILKNYKIVFKKKIENKTLYFLDQDNLEPIY